MQSYSLNHLCLYKSWWISVINFTGATEGFSICCVNLLGLGQSSGNNPALLNKNVTLSETSAPTPNQYLDLSKSSSICLYGLTFCAFSCGVNGIGTGLYVPNTSIGKLFLAERLLATTMLYTGLCFLPNRANLIFMGDFTGMFAGARRCLMVV